MKLLCTSLHIDRVGIVSESCSCSACAEDSDNAPPLLPEDELTRAQGFGGGVHRMLSTCCLHAICSRCLHAISELCSSLSFSRRGARVVSEVPLSDGHGAAGTLQRSDLTGSRKRLW